MTNFVRIEFPPTMSRSEYQSYLENNSELFMEAVDTKPLESTELFVASEPYMFVVSIAGSHVAIDYRIDFTERDANSKISLINSQERRITGSLTRNILTLGKTE